MAKTSWWITTLAVAVLMIFTPMLQIGAQGAEEQKPAVKIAEKEGIGRYLTDPAGMTLYYFTQDTPTMSACTGTCVEKWPVFYSEVAIVPAGCDVSDFDIINREDGNKQTTYKGMPLYYYAGDKEPGDTKGQALGGVWYTVEP